MSLLLPYRFYPKVFITFQDYDPNKYSSLSISAKDCWNRRLFFLPASPSLYSVGFSTAVQYHLWSFIACRLLQTLQSLEWHRGVVHTVISTRWLFWTLVHVQSLPLLILVWWSKWHATMDSYPAKKRTNKLWYLVAAANMGPNSNFCAPEDLFCSQASQLKALGMLWVPCSNAMKMPSLIPDFCSLCLLQLSP